MDCLRAIHRAISVSVIFNERQLQAIQHLHGPMLVVAGAGTGKTSVLVERLSRLIRNDHARSDEILALTFTENAAAEMAERVSKELGSAAKGLRATTFHAYCNGLLHQAGQNFGVLTKEDLWVYLRRRISDLRLGRYTRAASPGQFLEALLEFFERCHDEEVNPAAYGNYVERLRAGKLPLPRVTGSKLAADMSRDEILERCEEVANVFQRVEEMLASETLGTFAHMITRALKLLRSDERLRSNEQSRSRFLLVDEFQDVNLAQLELTELLAGSEQNLFGVGDPDQAIYRFRGASAAAFQEFVRRFPKTKCVVLSDNQRSRTPILKCAYAVISRNPATVPVAGLKPGREPLVSARDRRENRQEELLPRFPVDVVVADSNEQEAVEIARCIEEILRVPASRSGKSKHPRVAVLYRMHFHRDALVRELAARRIPFCVVGLNALDTPEVRDLLACLRAVGSVRDSGSLFRVAAMPMFGLDAEAMRQALKHADRDAEFLKILNDLRGGPRVLAAVQQARESAEKKKMRTSAALAAVIKRFEFDSASLPLVAFAQFVATWEGNPVAGDGNLAEFLEYMRYFPDAGGIIPVPTGEESADPNTVQMMTVHCAKGLEFENVFVLRMNQNSFPTSFRERLFEFPQELRRGLVPECDDRDIHKQEERRLFYVAMTRAREALTLCARPARSRRDPRPNAFVRDLMSDRAARPYWRESEVAPFTTDIAAAALAPARGVGAWLQTPPPSSVGDGPLSATAIERYETCPLQYKIEKLWNVPGEIAASMQFGNAVHTLLRDYFESLRAGRPKTADEVVELLRVGLAATPFVDPVQRQLYEREGAEQLREFVQRCESGPLPEVIGTERGFEITIGGVRVKGRLDRIDRIAGDRVAIIDYKTGKPRLQQHADRSLQLSIYALAAREKWNYAAERLAFYNVADNTEVASKREQRHLDDACARVAEVAERIAAGDFEPTPGFHCNWCAYRNLCPATEERLYQVQALATGVS
jgi:DNA helicase-2/ATP-dependent DNA helicase PcrA